MKRKRRRARHPMDGEGFRETFLVRFTRKGDASALRRLAFLVVELYIGARPLWWPYHREGDLRALLGAAVRDLRHLHDVLAWADRGETYDRVDALLASFAHQAADEVEGIANSIEQAIEHPDPPPPADPHP